MDDQAPTIGAKRAVAFDIEQNLQVGGSDAASRGQDLGPSSSAGADAGVPDQDLWDEDDYYDPYHGLGLSDRPDLPVLLVFNLMEFRRFKKFSSTTRTRLFYAAAIVGGSLLAASLVLCLVLLGVQLHERPVLPIVHVKSVSMGISRLSEVKPEVIRRQQEEGKGNYYAFKLNYICEVQMIVTNPNQHLDIHHSSIELTTFYHGLALAVDRIDNISHPRDSVIRPLFRAFAIALPVPLTLGYRLKQELIAQEQRNETATQMVAEIIFHSEISLLKGLRPLPFSWRCRCLVHNYVAYYEGFKCKCLDAKWRPREHLKHYRLPSWPRDYSEVGDDPMLSMPADYYDPSLNYYAEIFDPWYPYYTPYTPSNSYSSYYVYP